MKKRIPDKLWFPFWVDKWIFGSIRIECTPAERGIWVDMLSLAAKDDGFIRANEETPYPIDQLSGMLIIPMDELKKTIRKFIKNKKLTRTKSGTLYITKWNKYQFSDRHKSRLQNIEDEWDDADRPTYVINDRIRSSMYGALKNKSDGGTWEKLLNYTRKDLIKHLESKFKKGMNWENYGDWHIDHIIPLCNSKYRSFSDLKGIRKFWFLDNLSPLWAKENLKKSGKMSQNRDTVSQDKDTIKQNRIKENRIKENNIEGLFLAVKGIGKGKAKKLTHFIFDELTKEFPEVDVLERVKQKCAWWLDHPVTPKSRLHLQMRNWFKIGQGWIEERKVQDRVGRPRSKKPKSKEEIECEKFIQAAGEAAKKANPGKHGRELEIIIMSARAVASRLFWRDKKL